MYFKKHLWRGGGGVIGSLASHIGVLYYEFGGILAVGNLSKVRSWYNMLCLRVQTHRDHSIT